MLVDNLAAEIKNFPKDRPFFVFANILETHAPYLAPESFRRMFGKIAISDKVLRFLFSYGDRFWTTDEILTTEEQEIIRTLYDCEVRYTDFLIPQLVRYLETSGLMQNTILILTADHGGLLGEHNAVGWVRNTYQGIMRTPMIVYHPEHAPRIERRQTSIIDIFATILAATDAHNDCSFAYQCNDLFNRDWKREFVVCEIPPFPFPQNSFRRKDQLDAILPALHVNRTMIAENYKFVWRSNGKHLYFDLGTDPFEMRNLFPNMSPQRFKELVSKLTAWYEAQADSSTPFCLEAFDYNSWWPQEHDGQQSPHSRTAESSGVFHVIADRRGKIKAGPQPRL